MAFRQGLLNFFDTSEVTKIVQSSKLQEYAKLNLLAQGTEPKRFPV